MKIPHRITGTILAIVFASTTALPAAGIPHIKAPPAVKAAPRVVSPPKVPTAPRVPAVKVPSAPKIPSVPRVPKVPVVKVPVVKVPSVPKVPTAPKVPVVKLPVTPKIPAVRIPTVKTPVTPRIVKTPTAPKISVVKTPVVKTPTIKTPAVATRPRITKAPIVVKGTNVVTAPVIRNAIAINKPTLVKTGTRSSDNTIASITNAPPPDTRATVQGGSGSKKSKEEERDLTSAFRNQATSENAEGTDGDPYFNKKGGFARDFFRSEERKTNTAEVEQITGESLADRYGSTPVALVRGRIKDLAIISAEAQNAGVDENDPVFQDVKKGILAGRGIDVSDLQKLKNELANRGLDGAFGEAPPVSVKDLTAQGDELVKRGKFNEARDKFAQAKDALENGGKNSAKFRADIIAGVQLGIRPESDLMIVSNPNAGPQNGSNGGQDGSQSAGSGSAPEERSEPTDPKPAAGARTPDDRSTIDPATGKPAASPAEGTNSTEGEAPAENTLGRDVSAEIDFSGIDFEPDAPTDNSLVPIEPADDFYGPDGAAEPDATPPSDDDDILSPAPGGNGNGEQGSNSGSNGDNDKDDDKDNDTETPDTETETEAPAAPESEDDTAESSEEGTPNPEARDRNGYTGRLADQSGGRLGGDEQRRQKGAIDQRKNGNGAGGPNPEGNTSSGVLLTAEEQSAFAKNLGMKRGGGVTTPTEEPNTPAVTDRDLKDIAARLGSTINPANGGDDKGGSGHALGKKGFAPVGGVSAPAPRGIQAVRAANIQVDTVKVQQNAR